MAVIKEAGDNATVLSKNLAEITDKINNAKGALGMFVADTVFAKKLDLTITNLNEGIVSFKNNMDEMSDNLLIRGVFNQKDK